jgi:hypothetical protein
MTEQQHHYVLAADIADAHDYTALVIAHGYLKMEKVEDPFAKPKTVRRIDLIHVERFRGIGYPEQIERIAERYRELGRHARGAHHEASVRLVVDETGVGRPVVDMLRKAGLRPRGVLITGGDKVTSEGGTDRVPKKELASVLQVTLQARRLLISDELPLAPVLVKELEGFRVKISLSGNLSFGNDVGAAPWRTADHDDLVLATAIAVWSLEYRRTASRATLRRLAGLI